MPQKHAPPAKIVPRICQTCQKPFLATKQDVKKGWALYCDRKCRNAARMVFQEHSKGSGPVFEIRKASGLTQKQFAEAVGLSFSLITKCEFYGKWPGSSEARQWIEVFAQGMEGGDI